MYATPAELNWTFKTCGILHCISGQVVSVSRDGIAFKMLIATCPVTWYHIWEDWILQQPCCENLRFILLRSNKMQQYVGIYLLQNHSTYFWCPSHLSSGVRKTVTAASGTGHSIWETTFLQRGQILPRWRKVAVPEAAVTVLCTPDDGCDGHPKHVEWFCSK